MRHWIYKYPFAYMPLFIGSALLLNVVLSQLRSIIAAPQPQILSSAEIPRAQ
jgi:hypothetical protein